MKLVTVEEMREIEREADASGWTYPQMMGQAGKGVAEIVQSYYGYSEDRFALALIGSGNNGGDALIALVELALQGWRTAAYLARKRPEGDLLVVRLQEAGGLVAEYPLDTDYAQLDSWMQNASVLIDGVLGTGFKLPLRKDLAELLSHVRDAPFCPPVAAVDCPSGIDCDTGETAAECIPAEVTICMAAVKMGLLMFPAYSLIGELQIVPIGLNPALASWDRIKRIVIDEEYVRDVLPLRSDNGHKGTFGTALITAGSMMYPGAALLAGKAALKMGTGLVTLATPGPIQAFIAGQIPEATWVLLAHQYGCLSGEAIPVLIHGLEKANAFLLGPGIGLEDCTADFVRKLIAYKAGSSAQNAIGFAGTRGSAEGSQQSSGGKDFPPLVIDADGLKLLSRIADWPNKIPAPAVLTPHPGEMAILTGLGKDEIQANRIGIAVKFAREWGHVVVLKGAFTVIAAPDGRCGVIPVASSALAHAGTGDVLAGMIIGLRAQRIDAFESAATGAWIHARAGLTAEERMGHPASVNAGELINSLPEILSWIWKR